MKQFNIRIYCSAALALVTIGGLLLPAVAKTHSNKVPSEITTQAHFQTKQQRQGRWIEIDLSEQRLVAWDGDTAYYVFPVSTGTSSTPTPTGTYNIHSKHRTDRMTGPGYDIPDVPYAMYFHRGYALHGAYWHEQFGTRVSHGCINLQVSDARRLYNWADIGTTVVVRQ